MEHSIRKILEKKRDGKTLSDDEIQFVVNSTKNETIGKDQVAAFLMASFIQGLNKKETLSLTKGMLYSGKVLDFKDPLVVDKHSTGGIGDKTSFILAPIAASLGARVPMIAGRGLGHTGGTVDKIEAIKGFKTEISSKEFERLLKKYNIVLVGQSSDIAPVDKIFYAVRDVTSTVSSIPLITASIMSKKLAEGASGYVLDVKCGNGAFMESKKDALKLAKSLVDTGVGFNKKMLAVITDMNSPLGHTIGNSNEIIECIDVLKGEGPSDITEVSLFLSGAMVFLAGLAKDVDQGIKMSEESIKSGKAFDTFLALIKRQGGDISQIKDTSKLPMAPETTQIIAKKEGYIHEIDTKSFGYYLIDLGGGRQKTGQKIDHSVGLSFKKRQGDFVKKGEVLGEINYHKNQGEIVCNILNKIDKQTLTIKKDKPKKIHKLIQDIIIK